MAACFDVSRDTFRLKKFAEYKIQRPPMPDELSSQMPLIKEIISAYGIMLLEKEGFEADDIIATVCARAKKKGMGVTVISSDKDILQLVDDNTLVFSPFKSEDVTYDVRRVRERFGVTPDKITDIIALMGDDVDNIPGVPGVGEKTAAGLIRDFGSLDNVLNNIGSIKQEKIRSALRAGIEKIKLNRELALLDKEIDLDFDPEEFKIARPDYKELFRIFKRLEFKAFLKDLPLAEERELLLPETAKIEDSQLKDLMTGRDELLLYVDSAGSFLFSVADKFFRLGAFGRNIKGILADPKIRKISHDLKKMKVSLAKEGIVMEGLYFDTMLAAYLINPSKSEYNLEALAWDYLSRNVRRAQADSFNAVFLIKELKPKLEQDLRDKSLFALFSEIEMPLVEVLSEMELSGIKLDLNVLKSLSRDLEKRLIRLVEDIYDKSGAQFNINSPKQLREILFEKLKLPVVKRGKTGPSTDDEVLKALSANHELPALLLEYRQLMKLKTTYIDVLPELVDPGTGRIHTSFNQTGTETGRLSSSNPNLQNIPVKTDLGRNIRKAIIAFDSQSRLLSCDYSQIELRILAHISKDENLLGAFKSGKDVHKITSSLIYGLDEKDVDNNMRDVAKRINFGIIYGLSAYGLSRDLGISPDEAQKFIDSYFLRYPGVKDYIQGQIKKAEKEGFVTTILGRRRYIPDINNKNQAIRSFAQRQAVNTPIQGSASDLIKLAMVHIHNRIKGRGFRSRMIMQIHDELVFNVRREEKNEFIALVKDRMENVLKLDVPIKVDMKIGNNWLEMEEVK